MNCVVVVDSIALYKKLTRGSLTHHFFWFVWLYVRFKISKENTFFRGSFGQKSVYQHYLYNKFLTEWMEKIIQKMWQHSLIFVGILKKSYWKCFTEKSSGSLSVWIVNLNFHRNRLVSVWKHIINFACLEVAEATHSIFVSFYNELPIQLWEFLLFCEGSLTRRNCGTGASSFRLIRWYNSTTMSMPYLGRSLLRHVCEKLHKINFKRSWSYV